MGVNADPWCIMLSKSSHNFGSIVYQPTESRGTMVLSNAENLPPPLQAPTPPRPHAHPPPPKKKIYPFPKRQILDSLKTEEFADNFEFDRNGREFSRWAENTVGKGEIVIENTVGKGEIARYEQFLLFPQCFQKTCIADT